jgi:transposase InsO family protein
VSMSALRTWRKAKQLEKPLGRPRIGDEKRELARLIVAGEWCLQGLGAGEPSIFQALRGHVSRTLVRESLKSLKLDFRRRRREMLEARRQHIGVKCSDTMWSLDAQELARGVNCEPCSAVIEVPNPGPGSRSDPSASILGLPNGSNPSELAEMRPEEPSAADSRADRSHGAGIVQAEMIRDVASTKTLHASVGPPANSAEIVALLERAAAKRGAPPFVLATDNGGPYRSLEVREWCESRQVVHLFNEPYTPEHNPWVEHGHGEHQEEMMVGVWDAQPTVEGLRRDLEEATRVLDHGRLRATRGWRTAHDYDLGLPRAGGVISRAVFYEAACQATARAVEGLGPGRERRRAEREAILTTLQSFDLINRTRGGVPVPCPQTALIT